MNTLMVFSIILGVLLFFIIISSGGSEKYILQPDFIRSPTYLMNIDHRPYVGDYLPTIGSVPTGRGGYELESAVDDQNNMYLQSELCEECINNCIVIAYGKGQRGGNIKRDCAVNCSLECDPYSNI